MKKTRIAINGFGRIGRKVLRLWLNHQFNPQSNSKTKNKPLTGDWDGLDIVAINDLTDPKTLAHLLQYDSVHGPLGAQVSIEGQQLLISSPGASGKSVRLSLSAQKDPALLPWKAHEVDQVFECTGIFTDRAKAAAHLAAGAHRVVISAPSKDADATFCIGVNHADFDPSRHSVVSNASCTTNCLAPVAKVLDESFGIVSGTMLTIHSYTNDQQLLDLPHKDLRRARAAALSQIPTTTGAAKAVGLVLPNLKGKLDGLAIRVPTANVSLVDLTVVLKKQTTPEAINHALQEASRDALQGVLGFSQAPLVSTDFNGTTQSSTVDAELTSVTGGTMAKVLAWYDNESGFSARMLDLASVIRVKENGTSFA